MTTRSGARLRQENGIRAFFDDVGSRGRDPLLAGVSGTVRFDLTGGRRVERWYVTVRDGAVAAGHDDADADAVLRVDKGLFDEIVTGRANAIAAILRGAVQVEGDLSLPMAFQRLFPGPPASLAAATERAGR